MSKRKAQARIAKFKNKVKRQAEIKAQAAIEAERQRRLAEEQKAKRLAKNAQTKANRLEAKRRNLAGYNLKVRDKAGRIITRNVEKYIEQEIMSDNRLSVQEKIVAAEVFRETVKGDYNKEDGEVWARTVQAHNEDEALSRMFYNSGSDAATVAFNAGLNVNDVSNPDNWHDGYYFDPNGKKYEYVFDYEAGAKLVEA